jgi:hypothetical protein
MGGYVTNWTDAGRRRAVQYSKLPPGEPISSKSKARNEDGVWNPAAASLDVTVLPAFWQTASFRAAVAAALLAGNYRTWLFHFHPEDCSANSPVLRQQQALEKDRARIARDIHDQVGASLTQLSLLGEMVESDKEDPAEVAATPGKSPRPPAKPPAPWTKSSGPSTPPTTRWKD